MMAQVSNLLLKPCLSTDAYSKRETMDEGDWTPRRGGTPVHTVADTASTYSKAVPSRPLPPAPTSHQGFYQMQRSWTRALSHLPEENDDLVNTIAHSLQEAEMTLQNCLGTDLLSCQGGLKLAQLQYAYTSVTSIARSVLDLKNRLILQLDQDPVHRKSTIEAYQSLETVEGYISILQNALWNVEETEQTEDSLLEDLRHAASQESQPDVVPAMREGGSSDLSQPQATSRMFSGVDTLMPDAYQKGR